MKRYTWSYFIDIFHNFNIFFASLLPFVRLFISFLKIKKAWVLLRLIACQVLSKPKIQISNRTHALLYITSYTQPNVGVCYYYPCILFKL
jgi:hypothetical protein